MAAEMKTCDRKGCGRKFLAQKRTDKYHSRDCAAEAKRVKQREQYVHAGKRANAADPKRPKSLEEQLADQRKKDAERQHARELKKGLASENRVRRYRTTIRESLEGFEPTPLIRVGKTASKKAPAHSWVLLLSDWHVGQQTRIEETGGLYVQDASKVRAQVVKIWRALERIHAVESSGRGIDTLHILGLGDFPDGDNMRASQHRNVDDVVVVQTVQAFDLLAWLIRQALTIFSNVTVDMVGGNHSRLGKPGNAGLGELDYIDTMDWLIGAFLERTLEKDVESGRLDIRNWQTFFGYREILGRKFVFEHGSSFKWSANSYGGVPWYGVQNLGVKYESMLGGADVVCLGHGHRPSLIPNGRNWVISNGALPATSQFVQSAAKTISRPLQWLLSVHEDHAETAFVPLYADPEQVLLPGMVWEDPKRFAKLASSTRDRVGGIED